METIKTVPDLPFGRNRMVCTDCSTEYEYTNGYRAPEPACPQCGSSRWSVLPPKSLVSNYNFLDDPERRPLLNSKRWEETDEFSEAEYKAMALAHSLNTNEDIDWHELKRLRETKYY